MMLALVCGSVSAYVTEPYTVYDSESGIYETKVYTNENITLKTYENGGEQISVSKITDGNGYLGVCTQSAPEIKIFKDGTEIVSQSFDYTADFAVTATSAQNGYAPNTELYFEFSNPVDETGVTGIKLYVDGVEENISAAVSKNRITIAKKSGLLKYNAEYKIDLSTLTDLIGRKLNTPMYIFKSCAISERFSVYQEAETFTQAGIGGFAMLAETSGNTTFHFSRKTQIPETELLPFVPSCYAKIYDPDGDLAYIYDFTYSATGTEIREITLDCKSGIWQIQFISGRENDVLGIGISNAESWGIRGECILGVTNTTPEESYIYVPEKAESMIISSTAGSDFALYDENGYEKGKSAAVTGKTFAKTNCEVTDVAAKEVYKLKLGENFRKGLIIDRVPSLMCPTAEMAKKLKGGWRDVDGVVVQGAVQEKARKEALRILNTKNLDVASPERPQNVPDVESPIAESLLFGAYGLVSPVGDQVKRQETDPSSPYLGRVLTTAEYEADNMVSWETGNYNAWGSTAFGALVATEAELNYFYENDALAQRSALSILGSLAALSEDFIIREGDDAANYPTTHGNFYFSWIAKCYAYIRDYLDEETKEVIDLGFSALCDKQGNYRGMNVNNQWMFTVTGVDAVYRTAGESRHLDFLKRHIKALSNGAYGSRLGQSSAGYYIEGQGCDGSYHNLNHQLIYTMYKEHKASDKADSEIVSMLKESIKKNVEFNSLFWVSQPECTGAHGPNSFTPRTDAPIDCIDHISYPAIADEFPLAKRRFEIQNMPKSGVGAAGTFPYYINNDEWAQRLINSCWSAYEDKTKGYSSNGSPQWYEALKNVDSCTSEPLPCEYESGIWDKPGIIAVKHKGIYFNVFYKFPEAEAMPDKSYMGGGITMLWSEPTGNVIVSDKPQNYPNVSGADDISSTCVYGENENGDFVFSGKGTAELEWIEPEKSFKITENITNSNANVTWQYTLLENCVEMKVKAQGLKNGVLNIPIKKIEDNAVITNDETAVYYTLGESETSVSTKNPITVTSNNNLYETHITLDENGEAAVVLSAQNTGGMQITEETDGYITLLNGKGTNENVNIYYAEYDAENKLVSAEKEIVCVNAHEYKKIYKKDGKRTFVWDGANSPVQKKGK